ncbi:hypothetical protein F4778DRAFT_784050 [Xylariomycetidae sp. FL2044]|nr:hypothetical protein F4778DRAFT_784050 [Xylariomycetidae sp. FL2044]
MVAQLPHEAIATAAGTLVYSFLCMSCSSLMIWLVWHHHERDSYVAFLSYMTLVSTVASIAQQLHTIIKWRDIKIEQYYHAYDTAGSPELAVAGQAVALTQSIYGYTDLEASKHLRKATHRYAKGFAILLPIVLLSILSAPAVRQSYAAFFLLADSCLLLSLALGLVFLLAILAKYILTGRKLQSWNVHYGRSTRSHGTGPNDHHDRIEIPQQTNIYDRWLITRFTIAFLVIGFYGLVVVVFQLTSLESTQRGSLGDAPNLSAERAKSDFLSFMPGTSASLLVFIMFGTTKPFRETMYQTFVPRSFKRLSLPRLPASSGQYRRRGRTVGEDDSISAVESQSTFRLEEMDASKAPRTADGDDPWLVTNDSRHALLHT